MDIAELRRDLERGSEHVPVVIAPHALLALVEVAEAAEGVVSHMAETREFSNWGALMTAVSHVQAHASVLAAALKRLADA